MAKNSNILSVWRTPMRSGSIPSVGVRYWVVITVASIFGCNMGDFVSNVLHLGHVRGLPLLAAVFVALLVLERRRRRPSEFHYWAVVVVLRTAATNLSDLADYDMRLPFPWVIGALTVLLLLVARGTGLARRSGSATVETVPTADGQFWLTMLIAGTLGTAIGDDMSDQLDLGVQVGSIVLGFVLVVVLMLGALVRWSARNAYWSGIVAVRAFGTTAGDFCAFPGGLHLGLPLSTALTGAALVMTLLLWRRPRMTGLDPLGSAATV